MIATLKDILKIELKNKYGTINEFEIEGHTWTTIGLSELAEGMCVSNVAAMIDEMVIKGTDVSNTVGTTDSIESTTVSVFEGSFGTGTLVSNIGTIFIRNQTGDASSITISPFTKDSDTSMVITWKSTITGDWYYEGKAAMCTILTSYTDVSVNQMCCEYVTAPTDTITPGYSLNNTIFTFTGTFTPNGKTVNIFSLKRTGIQYTLEDVTNFMVPSGIELICNWDNTLTSS